MGCNSGLWPCWHKTQFVRSAGYGGGVVLADDNATWTLANITLSNFIDNTALVGDGGSVSVTGGITLLDKNTFLRSNAAGRGGAVMYVQKCIDIGSFVGEWLAHFLAWCMLTCVWPARIVWLQPTTSDEPIVCEKKWCLHSWTCMPVCVLIEMCLYICCWFVTWQITVTWCGSQDWNGGVGQV